MLPPARLERAAEELGLTHRRMPSGAGHDAHDLPNGASVLLRTVLAIDGGGL